MDEKGLIMLCVLVYVMFAAMWAKHAINMQMLVTVNTWKLTLTGIMNFLGFPICWVWSLFTKKKWDAIKHADHTKDFRNQ